MRDAGVGIGMVAAATAIGLVLRDVFNVADQALVQLVAIVLAGTVGGRVASVVAVLVAVAALDVFFVPPYGTFAVADLHHVVTFGVLLGVGLVVGELTHRVRAQAAASQGRERRAAALYEMTRELSALRSREDIAGAAVRHVRAITGVQPAIVRQDGQPVGVALGGDDLLDLLAATVAGALERARLAEEAEQARVVLETERTRTALLSAVSHDLRTPLAAITGAASAMIAGAARDHLLVTVRDESARLGRLIGDLLDLTRIEAAPEAKKEWVPIDEVVASAVDRLGADRDVRTSLPDDVVLVPMDPVLVDQLLFNLLENATRYAPDGPIEVSAARVGGGIEVEVHDHGPGLPEGTEDLAFQRFWRAGDGDRPGTGLGLTIAAAIARVHGGRTYVRNGPDGATFGFFLPIAGEAPTVPGEDS